MQISFSSLKDIDHYETTSVSEKLAAAAAAGVNVADPRSERGSLYSRFARLRRGSLRSRFHRKLMVAQVAQVCFGSTVHS